MVKKIFDLLKWLALERRERSRQSKKTIEEAGVKLDFGVRKKRRNETVEKKNEKREKER